MFNKTRHTAKPASAIPPLPDMPTAQPRAAAPAGPPPAPARGLSSLSADLQFDGQVSGSGDLQVDGLIKGDVRVGRLIVGETGSIEGGVGADYVEVRGRVVGAISGKQVKLVSTAYVDGDITAEQLSIDIGAYFQGRVLQSQRPAPKPAAQPAPVQTAPAQTPPAQVQAEPASSSAPVETIALKPL